MPESTLLKSLHFGKEDEWLAKFHSCLIKRHDKETSVEDTFSKLERNTCSFSSSDSSFSQTLKNPGLLVCKAEYYLQCGEYQKCFDATSALLARDPYHLKWILVHLAATVELGHSNDLYLMSCNLVKDYPHNKATSVDGTFPPGWIGAGNTYAAHQESDQAMSAYLAAARLFPGCHLPTLYIGMEYMRTHNFKLAEQFFLQARGICPSDPLVYNELGVVAYHMKEYEKAAQWFEAALDHVATSLSEMWEPTLVNLAHSQRKLKKYKEAITNYKKALDLSSQSLNTFAGLAYTYHLQENFDDAIAYYHKALWLKPNDQFCTEMLTLVLQDGCEGYDL